MLNSWKADNINSVKDNNILVIARTDNISARIGYGTARSYIGTLGTFKTYNNNKDLKFNELNYDFLLKYKSQYLSKGNSINGLSSNLRTIKAIYNKAIWAGFVKKEAYPFTNYKIRTIPTKKRAIDLESIKKIDVMLGHSKLNTTQIYLKSLHNNILDTYNEQIISFWTLKRKQTKPN